MGEKRINFTAIPSFKSPARLITKLMMNNEDFIKHKKEAESFIYCHGESFGCGAQTSKLKKRIKVHFSQIENAQLREMHFPFSIINSCFRFAPGRLPVALRIYK